MPDRPIDADLRGGLVILGGPPDGGKTSIARRLARDLGAVHIRIHSIEQALRSADNPAETMNDAGYRTGYAIAKDSLLLGLSVVADSVNPLEITRSAWRSVALDRPSLLPHHPATHPS
ncbi:MAG TPA: kinase [Dehalococcoidia bacterium]|nr:kinase [Dehalococcoidia bacterium]